MTPGLSSMGVGSNLERAPVDPETLSVLRARPDCEGRLFTAKFGIVVHYLPHQLLNHLPADDAILLACQFCDCLRDRVDHFLGLAGIDRV